MFSDYMGVYQCVTLTPYVVLPRHHYNTGKTMKCYWYIMWWNTVAVFTELNCIFVSISEVAHIQTCFSVSECNLTFDWTSLNALDCMCSTNRVWMCVRVYVVHVCMHDLYVTNLYTFKQLNFTEFSQFKLCIYQLSSSVNRWSIMKSLIG